jgi:putative DNA sulfur modification protein dndE
MAINVKTSKANAQIVTKLTLKLHGQVAENVVARIALSYSLFLGKRFDLQTAVTEDSQGKEYKEETLFGAYMPVYLALFRCYYALPCGSEQLAKCVKLHLDHGLEELEGAFEQSLYTFGDLFRRTIPLGLKALEGSSGSLHIPMPAPPFIPDAKEFGGQLRVKVGHRPDGTEEYYDELSSSADFSNSHMAIVGESGSGKTQFAYALLRQVHAVSQGQVPFMYLDFKGISEGEQQDSFFRQTSCQLVQVGYQPFPVNPLSAIDNVNAENRTLGITTLIDMLAKVNGFGTVQRQRLKKAITAAFDAHPGGEYPTFQDVKDNLECIKPDSLDALLDDVVSLRLFGQGHIEQLLRTACYVSLPPNIPEAARFSALLLILNYLFCAFSAMTDVQGVRFVLAIDEAHVVLRQRRLAELIESMLRTLRSKGVIMMLLSQGLEEFMRTDFDFTTQCAKTYLLKTKALDPQQVKNFLGMDGAFRSLAPRMAYSRVVGSNPFQLVQNYLD